MLLLPLFLFLLMVNLLNFLVPHEASTMVTLSPHIYSSSWLKAWADSLSIKCPRILFKGGSGAMAYLLFPIFNLLMILLLRVLLGLRKRKPFDMLWTFIWQLQEKNLISTNLPFTFLTVLILFSTGLLVSCDFRLGHFL